MDNYRFPTELKNAKYRIERFARRMGLDMFPIMYIIVNDQEMAELAARKGFPVTEHHWRYGQESLRGKKEGRYSITRLYELVINTVPAYAYLLRRNEEIHQRSVMAHVCGHVDFFKHNAYFSPTNRDMLNARASDAHLVQEYLHAIGHQRVKEFMDEALSFEWCLDPQRPHRQAGEPAKTMEERIAELDAKREPKRIEPKEELGSYMDQFLNPPFWLDKERARLALEVCREIENDMGTNAPAKPERDLLLFLIGHAPLEYWQKDILAMIRRHQYYFMPIVRTRIMNEGWAALWQEIIMNRETGMLDGGNVIEHCNMLAGILDKRGGQNPYCLGMDLWLDIMERWNIGKHDDIWDQCPHASIREHWELFAVFKSVWDARGGQPAEVKLGWREVTAFIDALKKGTFKIPAGFFVRNARTRQELIPAWHKYRTAVEERDRLQAILEQMEPLELQADLLYRHLLTDKPPTMPDEELSWKARQQIYEEAGQQDLWLWTRAEIQTDIRQLDTMLEFSRMWHNDPEPAESIPVPDEWYSWATRHPEPIQLMRGTEKIFQVRTTHDDLAFLQEFFTQEFCERNRYFLYVSRHAAYDDQQRYFLESRSFRRIKWRLLLETGHAWMPVIRIHSANHNNTGGLYLVHEHEGVDLDWWSKENRYMAEPLRHLFHLWGGANDVYLETIITEDEPEPDPWENWRENQLHDTDELSERTGTRVVFWYGLRKNKAGDMEERFDKTDLEQVSYRAPW